MKRLFIATCLMLVGGAQCFAQSELPKDSKIEKYKIKNIVVNKSDFETGKEQKHTEYLAKYDDKAQLIEYQEWDENGKFVKHEKYEYNANGDKTKETQFNAANKVQKINEYKYQNGLIKEKTSYLPNGKVKSKKVYYYDFY